MSEDFNRDVGVMTEPPSPQSLAGVREILAAHGLEGVLIVRHDLRNIARMVRADRPDGNYDTILRADDRGVRWVAVFEATNQTNAVFQRLYRKRGSPRRRDPSTRDFDWGECLERVAEPRLENRLVIPVWPAPRSYCLKRESVHLGAYIGSGHRALAPPPERLEDVHLDWQALSVLVHLNHLYEDWQTALSQVDGVYAIRDVARGHVYVGTTFNRPGEVANPTRGVWDRWVGYARTDHNDNVLLRDHVEAHGTRDLVICLLEAFPIDSRSQVECEARESLWKTKLRSRRSVSGALGLNKN